LRKEKKVVIQESVNYVKVLCLLWVFFLLRFY